MNNVLSDYPWISVSAGCHINDVMNTTLEEILRNEVSAGCHINDVMNSKTKIN